MAPAARIFLLALLLACHAVQAQQAPVQTIGILTPGGESYAATIAGLRDGLRAASLEEGKHFVLHIRDVKGDLRAAEAAARTFEDEKVALLCTFSTSTTLAAKRGTRHVPIAFYAGTDPVTVGLVQSYSKPGARFTGVHGQSTDLTAKRVQMLRDMVPGLRRVVAFYNPDNEAAQQSLDLGRRAARQLNIEVIERPVRSIEELHAALRALHPGKADGVMHISDSMITSDADYIVQAAGKLKLATLFQDKEVVKRGALASYGLSYYTIGRQLSKTVERLLKGARPAELAVEQVDRVEFVVNLKTAKALGLVLPPSIRNRADEIIE
jgi:putative ABC transport system substrate-binding protein